MNGLRFTEAKAQRGIGAEGKRGQGTEGPKDRHNNGQTGQGTMRLRDRGQ